MDREYLYLADSSLTRSAKKRADVSPKHLESAAEHLTLRRDVIHVIDAVRQKEENKGQSERQTSDAKEPNPK